MRFYRSKIVILLSIFLCLSSTVDARGKQKKKLTLAQLAALEWKLEQASTALSNTPEVAKRQKALSEIASIDDPRIVQPLAKALREDPDPSIRTAALLAIAKIKTPEAKGLLLLAEKADPDTDIRSAAQAALRKYPKRMEPAKLQLKAAAFRAPKGKATLEVLEKTLALPSGDARLWAIETIIKDKNAKGVVLAGKHLSDDPSARVRGRSASALAELIGSKAIPALVKATADGDPAVRFLVAKELSKFDDADALAAMQLLAEKDANATIRAEVRDLLEPSTPIGRSLLKKRIAALSSTNPALRIAALGELAQFTDWRAIDPMSCTLMNDDNLLVRKAAADALSRMHDTSVLTALRASAILETDPALQKTTRSILMGLRTKIAELVKQLSAADATQRILAARALGQAVYPGGVPPLKGALKDKDERVRIAVVNALSNYDDKAADEALRLMGADSSAEIRTLVDTHFKKRERLKQWRTFYKDPNRLVMKTTDKDPIWRADAAIALGIAGAETATTNLIRLLIQDKEESVRLAAAWALVLMSSDDSGRALHISAKDDKSEKVRLTARKYLIIEKVSVDDLLPQLRAEDAQARQDAAEALSLLASKKVAPHLIRSTMCDTSPAVRAAALRGLARVASPWTRQVAKTSSLRDKDKQVRRSAMVMYILAGGK